MKTNLFLILTLILVLLLSAHTFLWITHILYIESGMICCHYHFEEVVMSLAFVLSIFLASIGLIAYFRDGQRSLLIIAMAYLVLLTHCGLWFLEMPLGSSNLFNIFRTILFFLAIILILLAVHKRRE